MYALLDAEQGSTSKVDPVPVVRVHSSLLILEPDKKLNLKKNSNYTRAGATMPACRI